MSAFIRQAYVLIMAPKFDGQIFFSFSNVGLLFFKRCGSIYNVKQASQARYYLDPLFSSKCKGNMAASYWMLIYLIFEWILAIDPRSYDGLDVIQPLMFIMMHGLSFGSSSAGCDYIAIHLHETRW